MTKEEFEVGFSEFLNATADKLDQVATLPYLEMKQELIKMAWHLRLQVWRGDKLLQDGYRQRPA